jgi:hypothetical protein
MVNPVTTRYRQTKVNGKNVLMHRKIASEHLGRPLRPDEVVHHKDEDKLNNDPSNFEIMTAAEHGRLHNPQWRPTTSDCAICGTTFTPHKTKRGRKQTCSRECMKALLSARWREHHPRSS